MKSGRKQTDKQQRRKVLVRKKHNLYKRRHILSKNANQIDETPTLGAAKPLQIDDKI
jgi:hypothetical protein